MFQKDPRLKCSEFEYKKEENSAKNIATNKVSYKKKTMNYKIVRLLKYNIQPTMIDITMKNYNNTASTTPKSLNFRNVRQHSTDSYLRSCT